MNDTKNIAAVTVFGTEWTVEWEEDKGDGPMESHHFLGQLGTPPSCWCERVKLGGIWHWMGDVFSEAAREQFDAALRELHDNRF